MWPWRGSGPYFTLLNESLIPKSSLETGVTQIVGVVGSSPDLLF